MTKDRARKHATHAHAAAAGISYTEAHHRNTDEQPGAGPAPTWGGIDRYAFPPEPPKDSRMGVPTSTNQRHYFQVRRRWAARQVAGSARIAAQITSRAHHLADWWPDGHVYYGHDRPLAINILYAITAHEWPDLLPNAETLAELVAAGDPWPVDAAYADFDRHARLLTDTGYWTPTGELVERAIPILREQSEHDDRLLSDHARGLLARIRRARAEYTGYDGYPTSRGFAMPGALNTLDAVLCSTQRGYPPGTVLRYRDGKELVLAEVDRCVWAPSGGAPTGYAVHWFRRRDPGGFRRAEEIVPAAEVSLPRGATAPWMSL